MPGQPSDEDKTKLLDQLQKYNEIEAQIFALLAGNKFEELERLGDGNGLSAIEIAKAYVPEQWPETRVKPRGMSRSRSISLSTIDSSCTVKVRRKPFGESQSSPTLCYTVNEERDSRRIINIKSIGGARSAGAA